MLIRDGLLFGEDFRFHTGSLATQDDRISEIRTHHSESASAFYEETFDAQGCYVIPGLIDLHIHGAAGRDFCDDQPGALPVMGRYLAQNGITTFTPASLSLPEDRLNTALTQARQYQKNPGENSAMLGGIYMEGPFFSKEKKGAHAEEYIVRIDPELFDRLNAASGHLIKVVCLAPELEGALDFITAKKAQTTLSIAHTTADYEMACAAFDAGASLVTHLFNAMKPFGHREPGVPGAAFDKRAFVELIADGVHLHPAVIRAAFRLYGADRVILVSDAMAACGMPDGEYPLGNLPVHVSNGTARLLNGTIAGSATNLMESVRRAVRIGIPLVDALRATTANPAIIIGLNDRIGSLTVGKQADLVILDQQLQIVRVLLRGAWLT